LLVGEQKLMLCANLPNAISNRNVKYAFRIPDAIILSQIV